MSKRRIIGVFTGQIEMPAQQEVLNGIAKEALKNNMDVAVFSTLVQEGGYEGFQNGEVFVFDIANLDKLDAIIIFPETLRLKPTLLDDLCNRIRKNTKIIKITYDREIEGFVPFLCDDIVPSKYIVSHLIKEHGCKNVFYMTGKEGHPHSLARLEGYKQALEENGIPYDESKVYYGDFWYYKADELVERMIAEHEQLPEAIACANEPMAISTCEALARRGINVPEDVRVIGFDHSGDGIHKPDYVTSIRREEAVKGREMVRYITSVLDGVEGYEPIEKTAPQIYIGKTCGCQVPFEDVDPLAHTEEGNFHSVFNFMNENMVNSQTLNDFVIEVDRALNWMNTIKSFNLVMTEKTYMARGESFKRDTFVGNERMIFAYRVVNEDENEKASKTIDLTRFFDKSEMLPTLSEEERKPEVYIFNILHFNEEVFGYIVVSYNDEPYCCNRNYPFWVKNLNNACESLRRLTNARYMYQEADRKAITDTMTGLYNRNGFNRMINEAISEMADDETLVLMEFDNNNLKKVNDKYGHEAGDEMILLSTQAIEKSRVPGANYEANFRVGGDEYVKIAIGAVNESGAEQAKTEVEQFLENVTYVLDRPYDISMACGYNAYKKTDIHSVDSIMRVVDERMYQRKEQMKREMEEV